MLTKELLVAVESFLSQFSQKYDGKRSLAFDDEDIKMETNVKRIVRELKEVIEDGDDLEWLKPHIEYFPYDGRSLLVVKLALLHYEVLDASESGYMPFSTYSNAFVLLYWDGYDLQMLDLFPAYTTYRSYQEEFGYKIRRLEKIEQFGNFVAFTMRNGYGVLIFDLFRNRMHKASVSAYESSIKYSLGRLSKGFFPSSLNAKIVKEFPTTLEIYEMLENNIEY